VAEQHKEDTRLTLEMWDRMIGTTSNPNLKAGAPTTKETDIGTMVEALINVSKGYMIYDSS
jgi:hypothetical protein